MCAQGVSSQAEQAECENRLMAARDLLSLPWGQDSAAAAARNIHLSLSIKRIFFFLLPRTLRDSLDFCLYKEACRFQMHQVSFGTVSSHFLVLIFCHAHWDSLKWSKFPFIFPFDSLSPPHTLGQQKSVS